MREQGAQVVDLVAGGGRRAKFLPCLDGPSPRAHPEKWHPQRGGLCWHDFVAGSLVHHRVGDVGRRWKDIRAAVEDVAVARAEMGRVNRILPAGQKQRVAGHTLGLGWLGGGDWFDPIGTAASNSESRRLLGRRGSLLSRARSWAHCLGDGWVVPVTHLYFSSWPSANRHHHAITTGVCAPEIPVFAANPSLFLRLASAPALSKI